MSDTPLEKRYYSISEVAEMFQVSKSLVRFWENEFDTLRPHKNSKGDRRFTPQNLEQFQLIYQLVKERGFTLDGAKQEIKRQHTFAKEKAAMLQSLENLRGFLLEARENL
ncbi:MAG: MerR family transcriptional regulator [Bacteroidetes bacterium]|nr:MAG: MerR family transcriptional regulator [Bacteroidota bacterium]PTM14575.1 MAG: MerR family transcriptional regulator [Bacteroidota bacterium]